MLKFRLISNHLLVKVRFRTRNKFHSSTKANVIYITR